MGKIPKNAKVYDLSDMTECEKIKLIRSVLMKHEYLYSSNTRLVCSDVKWWDEDNMREDGHEITKG